MFILLVVCTQFFLKIYAGFLTLFSLGSIPEKEESSGKIYNTLTAYDPTGKMIAKHRKVHLFDIDVPGKIKFKVNKRVEPTARAVLLMHYNNRKATF